MILDRVVSREPLTEHDGRSGATLERVVLDDGTRLIVKSADPNNDITMVATGNVDRELRLFATGALARLDGGVGHPIVDVWREGDQVVTVMRDLGDTIPGWSRVLDRGEVERVVRGLASMHRVFLGSPPADLCPLETRLSLLGRDSMASVPGGLGGELPAAITHGWDCFSSLVPADVSAAVFAVHRDPGALAEALRGTGPSTLCHADLWPVNLALEPEQVTLLDWAIATEAPPVLDLEIYLTGSSSHVTCSRDEVIELFRAASPSCSDEALALGLFAGLCDMAWNKALDATEHEDPTQRATAAADLAWWVTQGQAGLALL